MNTIELQTFLSSMGFYKLKVDGIVGTGTKNAAIAAIEKYEPRHRVDMSSMSRILVGAEQIIMREIGGLAVGPIDGIAGSITTKARNYWTKGPWRNSMMQAQKGDERMPAPVKTVWPTQSQVRQFFGEPGTNLTMFYPPYPLRLYTPQGQQLTRFQCHAKVKDSLGRVLKAVLDHYGYDRLKELRMDVFSGCYNARPMRGGTALSMHSWGIAVDWDAQRNGLHSNRNTAAFARPEYEAWWNAWTAEGWLSLGKARDFDWMHVQAARLG